MKKKRKQKGKKKKRKERKKEKGEDKNGPFVLNLNSCRHLGHRQV